MTTITGQNPFPYFTDSNGKSLENGNIYIGVAGSDAKTNPITVYFDDAKTITAAQPIRTVEGYPVNAGSPSNFFTGGDFSITVEDSADVLIYSKLRMNANDLALFSVGIVYKTVALLLASTESSRGVGEIWKVDGPDGEFSYEEVASGGDLANSAAIPVQLDVVASGGEYNIKAFGPTGDGVTDISAKMQSMFDAIGSDDGEIVLPPGSYLMDTVVTLTNGSKITIRGDAATITTSAGNFGLVFFDAGTTDTVWEGITFDANDAAQRGIFSAGNLTVSNCTFNNFSTQTTFSAGVS